MSTSMQKQLVKQTWETHKLQEAATKMVAFKIVSRLSFIENHPGKEIEEMEKKSAQLKAVLMKQSGVRTPIDLVRHLAEIEVNMYGAQASYEGDDQKAVLFNEKPTVWLEAKKIINMTRDQEQTMQKHYRQWMEELAQGLGFRAQVELAPDGNSSKITFFR